MKVLSVAIGCGTASFQAPVDDVRVAFCEPWLVPGGSFPRSGGTCQYAEGGIVRWTCADGPESKRAEAYTLEFLKSLGGAFANYNQRILGLYGLSEQGLYRQIVYGRDAGLVTSQLYRSVDGYPADRPSRVTVIQRLLV